MALLLFVVILIIPILVTIAILEKFTKNKTSTQIMLMGIQFTIVWVGVIAIGGGISSNEDFYFKLVGLTIVLMGLTASIYGFIKK